MDVCGLKIVEIKEVFDATLTHHIPIDAAAADVRVESGHAYIAAGEEGVLILNVRDANRPKMTARISTSKTGDGR